MLFRSYATKHHLNMIQLISTMFSARNAQWMMNTLVAKAPQILRDSMLIGKTPNNLAIYQSLLKTNPELAEAALGAQWQNVLTIIGYQVMPKLVPLMVSFAKDLNSLSGWMQQHPKITSGIVVSLGALSGALVVLGNVMMTRAVLRFTGLGPLIAKGFAAALPLILNPVGLTIAAIVGIGAAAYLLYKNWDSVRPFLLGVWHGIEVDTVKVWGGIRTDMGEITGWMRHEWDDLTQWFHRSQASSSLAPSRAAQDWASSGGSPAGARYILPRANGPTIVNFHVDSKKLQSVLVPATARALIDSLSAPQTGPSFFDGRGMLMPAGGI